MITVEQEKELNEKIGKFYESLATLILNHCRENNWVCRTEGVFSRPNGLHMAFGFLPKVEYLPTLLREDDIVFLFPLLFPEVCEKANISLEEYGREFNYGDEKRIFVGVEYPGRVDYNHRGDIGRDCFYYVTRTIDTNEYRFNKVNPLLLRDTDDKR